MLQGAAAALLAVIALLGSGCFSISAKSSPTVYRYQLEYPPPQPQPEPLAATISLMHFRTASAYDRTDIVYREGEHRLGTYNYRRWAVPPARMIGDLIGRDLVASKMFRAVAQGPSPLTTDVVLGGFVEEIEERVAGSSSAHLRIRFTLTYRGSAMQAEPLFQKVYAADEPYQGSDVDDLVDAMSRALSSISLQLRTDLVEAIAAKLH